ncbi:LOW QUALITY PROTEIN: 60S ribosomal protein L28-like [Lynx canadensis]|uniref:LOW QUALITY PROTEIN: 60S ribosomal protein L28-like n=1 Tax=Lynx canadensis TaxID=61383 RepID=UPI0013C5242F|nr:LOW QUALITY PROTEIN: 60S ribosomal protein L28-like [Lynx canadensis]
MRVQTYSCRHVHPLQRMVVRNCSRFRMRRTKRARGTEPHNLKARNFRYDRLIPREPMRVEPPPAEDKGVDLVEQRSGQRKPATSYVQTTMGKNAGATPSSIRHQWGPGLPLAAILRAGATLAATAWNEEEAGPPTKSS